MTYLRLNRNGLSLTKKAPKSKLKGEVNFLTDSRLPNLVRLDAYCADEPFLLGFLVAGVGISALTISLGPVGRPMGPPW